MKKYLFIYKSELMTTLQYIFNILAGYIGYFIHIFIFLNIWQYIYSDPSQIINGYNMNQMVWYVIITEILWSILDGRKLCKKISQDVRSGNIAYNINKPYNYIGYCLSTHLGTCTLKLVIYTLLGITTGYLFLHSFPSISIMSVLMVIVTSILALVISILIITFIGLFSFIVEDANPFYWLYSKFILMLGTIFPIEYFPKILQSVLRYSPIYAVSYGPARLFVNFNINECINIILVQIIYIFISYILCTLIYNRGVKKLNVNGG